MGKTKSRGRYQSISLPVPFVQEVKKHIINDAKYKSIADFTRDAIREKMRKDELYLHEQPSIHGFLIG